MIRLLLLLACVLTCSTAEGSGCGGVYGGIVEQVWPSPMDVVRFGGVLTAFYDEQHFTHFTVNGVHYTVQFPNVFSVTFNNVHCTFGLAYFADPIFRDDTE